jgi:hypothetical protein
VKVNRTNIPVYRNRFHIRSSSMPVRKQAVVAGIVTHRTRVQRKRLFPVGHYHATCLAVGHVVPDHLQRKVDQAKAKVEAERIIFPDEILKTCPVHIVIIPVSVTVSIALVRSYVNPVRSIVAVLLEKLAILETERHVPFKQAEALGRLLKQRPVAIALSVKSLAMIRIIDDCPVSVQGCLKVTSITTVPFHQLPSVEGLAS